jgi:hypothetical protein
MESELISRFYFDAFSSREPEATSLENALAPRGREQCEIGHLFCSKPCVRNVGDANFDDALAILEPDAWCRTQASGL